MTGANVHYLKPINEREVYFMRNRLFFISIAILLLLPASLCVADDQVNIDGKWKCEAPGGQGVNAKITLTFKVNGKEFTGTLDNDQVGPAEMKEGKIEGNKVSFHLDRDIQGMKMKIKWVGNITGEDEIKFKREVEMEGGGFGGGGGNNEDEIVAKRVKE